MPNDLFEQIAEWQKTKARWIAIGETYRPLFTKVIKELVRDDKELMKHV
jgi:hypothetical protein